MAKQVQWAKDDVAQKERRLKDNQDWLVRNQKRLAELTGEEEE